MMFQYYEWLILAFPILGALILGLLGRRLPPRAQRALTWGSMAGALIALLPLLIGELLRPGLVGRSGALPWFKLWSGTQFIVGSLVLRTDALSVWMALTTIAVGLLAPAYVAHHADQDTQHTLLALAISIVTSTLLFVFADNLLCSLLGWSLSGWFAFRLIQNAPAASLRGGGPSPERPTAKTSANAHTDQPSWGLLFLLFSVLSSLCLLFAIGMVSELCTALSIDGLAASLQSGIVEHSLPEGTAGIVLLLVAAAMLRAAQFPFHAWMPPRAHVPGGPAGIANAFLYALVTALPGTYLLIRMVPLIAGVPFGLPLLFWWGTGSALLMAWTAMRQTSIDQIARFTTISLGGLCIAGVGQGAVPAVLAFLPAFALLQAAIEFALDIRGPTGRWWAVIGLASLAGYPLLPAFPLVRSLLASTFTATSGFGIPTALAVLALAASVLKAFLIGRKHVGKQPVGSVSPLHPGVLFALVAASILLGWVNLASPSPVAQFLAPVAGNPGDQPLWWWATAIAVVAAGAGLGYWLRDWPRKPAQPDTALTLYRTWIARPLLQAGHLIAYYVEERPAQRLQSQLDQLLWNLGIQEQAALDREQPDRPKPGRFQAPSRVDVQFVLLLFLAGMTLIVAYLIFR
jgi:NADH:ubiquinone oxidoreductase subunit 5 (subunit L)/multisubunit Na+/H+ antiporter MnhA subunit